MISCSLSEPASLAELQPNPVEQGFNRPGSVRICTRAAIGLAYNGVFPLHFGMLSHRLRARHLETAIMVATRSRVLPSSTRDSSLNSMNLALPLNLEMSSSEPESPIEWDNWGDESSIELCEVRLNFDGNLMGEHQTAARDFHDTILGLSTMPLPPLQGPNLGLTNLAFISTPPTPPEVAEAPQGVIYLAASYLDFGDCKFLPDAFLSHFYGA